MTNTNYYGVIMAGGVGSRLWPESRTKFPKQFCDILGSGKTLLQKTFDRLVDQIPVQNILVLTNQLYLDLVKEQLPQINENQIVLEPAMRNTAPSILLAALKIKKSNPKALMVVAPSDHWIEDQKAFHDNLQSAFDASTQNQNLLMTLGIQPTLPHTGYGYIKFEENSKTPVKQVLNFTEKPDYTTAKQFITSGNYVWNAGIFIWSVEAILNAFQKHLPEMFQLFEKGFSTYNTSDEKEFLQHHYAQAENISIDFGIMEKAEEVGVIAAQFDWSDLGSWDAIYEKLPKDTENNVAINTKILSDQACNNLVKMTTKKVVVLQELNNYIVIENDDVLYIGKRGNDQNIKHIREKVKHKFGEHLI